MSTTRRTHTALPSDDTAEHQLADLETTGQRNRNLVQLLMQEMKQRSEQDKRTCETWGQLRDELGKMTTAQNGVADALNKLDRRVGDLLDDKTVTKEIRRRFLGIIERPIGIIFSSLATFFGVLLTIASLFFASRCGVKLPVNAVAAELGQTLPADSEAE